MSPETIEAVQRAVEQIYADIMFDAPEMWKEKIAIRIVDLVAQLEESRDR